MPITPDSLILAGMLLKSSTIENIIPVLRDATKRALDLKLKGFPTPYYCSFLLKDIHTFECSASHGSIYRAQPDRTRDVYCDIRVGSYKYDQTSEGGLKDNDEEQDSVFHVSAPIDDLSYDGLRVTLWKLSELKFKEALDDYTKKESKRIRTLDPTTEFATFTPLPGKRYIGKDIPPTIDQVALTKLCRDGSQWLGELPELESAWVDCDSFCESRVFVSTENRTLVQHSSVYSLNATLRARTSDGAYVEQILTINCGSIEELPTLRTLKILLKEKYDRVVELKKAQKIHAFSGPVLLAPVPAGLLFHEAIGHRLEGSRLLSRGEGQTFKGQVGKKVLPYPLTIRDDPTLATFKGRKCIGSYQFDDEGAEAEDAVLIEKGELKSFLTTRAAISKRGHRSNGHARNKRFQRPVSRMAVTIVEAEDGISFTELKNRLIEEITRQGKPFGLIVYDTCGGETETSSYDFQAFFGEIAYATLVYPDGREECVRGVNFVGTPLQALHNIVAAGNVQEMDNGFCGAESGFIPVTTISPAILIGHLELQSKEEELTTPFLLSKPKLKKKR